MYGPVEAVQEAMQNADHNIPLSIHLPAVPYRYVVRRKGIGSGSATTTAKSAADHISAFVVSKVPASLQSIPHQTIFAHVVIANKMNIHVYFVT